MFKKISKFLAVFLAIVVLVNISSINAKDLIQKMDVVKGINISINEVKSQLMSVDGKPVDVFVSDGTTYAPVRAISEAAGYTVGWDNETKTVLIGNKGEQASNDIAYLKEYFNVELSENPSKEELQAAFVKLGLKEAKLEGNTLKDLAPYLVAYSNLKELATTYEDENKEILCLKDLGLVPTYISENKALSKNAVAKLLINAIEASGNGRNYIGLSSDKDILARIKSSIKSFTVFSDKKLTDLGDAIVKSGATTGYNLKYAGYDARFLKENTLKYGHDNSTHAAQLMGLLNKNNIEAKVQIEPKISVYQYLLEWNDGKVPDATPTYQVREVAKDFYLTFAVEYDMLLEFNSKEDKDKFDVIINKNAKKSSDNPDKKGLIAGSWWQPLYTSTIKEKSPEFVQINDAIVRNGDFSIHPFVTNEKLKELENKINELGDGLKAEPEKIWCNAAFYRYISGESNE